jgi:glucokinase
MPPKQQGGKKFILGLDIGGTKCAVVLGDERMRIRDRLSFPTNPSRGLKKTLREIFGAISEIIRRNRLAAHSIGKAGISCGGPLDSEKGLVLSPPNLPGWNRVPIVQMLRQRLGCPVRLENDANACALAEWKFGAGKGCRDVIFLTFGTGLGAGLILNGRLYRGANGMAGEAGHIRLAEEGPAGYGKKGSFEGFCSGGGIARMAEKGAGQARTGLTARTVFEAAQKGDKTGRRIVQTSGRYLGRGLAVLIDLLNPERIIIGGIYSRNEKLLRPALQKELAQEALARSRSVCRIVSSELGEKIGDVASLCVAVMDQWEV